MRNTFALDEQAVDTLAIVEHGFTHFPLQQAVYVARTPAKTKAPAGMRWIALAELHGEALPNVMRKVIAHAGLSPKPAR